VTVSVDGRDERNAPGLGETLVDTEQQPLAGSSAAASEGALAKDDDMPERIGRFAVRGRLGSGGMGTVFEGYDAELDRRIAIKVVNRGGSTHQERLLREAQALARVSHPNVVPVFEVGTHRDAVFIAMELVDGETLGAWRKRASPKWREIVDVFVRAGRGLAAAHAAGLVHRDFKPDNVMVGRDGRVRVMDFGLVRGAEEREANTQREPLAATDVAGGGEATLSESESASASASAMEVSASSGETPAAVRLAGPSIRAGSTGRFSETLTHAGTILGTPAYMSPEQFHRLPADPRSDQFSFCVALYEALYDQRPFRGGNLIALARAVIDGDVESPPADARVPSWLRRCLLRGLAPVPKDRWPDMAALLDALGDDPVARRRRTFAAVGAAGLVAVLAGLAFAPRGNEGPSCNDGALRVEAVWNAERAAQLPRAFPDDAPAFVRPAVTTLIPVLDDYAARLGVAHDEACVAYHREHTISDAAFDLRQRCLEVRRGALAGVVEEIGRGEVAAIEHVDGLLATLPEIAGCEGAEDRTSVAPPPAEHAVEVAAIRELLAATRAQLAAARFEGLEARVADLHERAVATGYQTVVAETALVQAALPSDGGDTRANYAAAFEALRVAGRTGDPVTEVSAALRLSEFAHDPNADRRHAERARWAEFAEAKLDYLGWPPELEIAWRNQVVSNAHDRTNVSVARNHLERVVELVEARHGSPSVQRGRAYANLGEMFAYDNDIEPALHYLGRAHREFEATIGKNHPLMGRLYLAAADAALTAGHFETNRALLRQARDVFAAVFGPDSDQAIRTLEIMAISYDLEDKKPRARELLVQALELRGERDGAETSAGFQALNSLCFIEYKLGRFDVARRECERAVANIDTVYPTKHPARAIVHNNLALIARAEGEAARALELDREALAVTLATVGPDHALTAYSYVGIGESLLALGEGADAVEPLEKAVKTRPAGASEPGERGEAQCLLARALPRASRARAEELAAEGLADLEAAGPNWAQQAKACRAWLGPSRPTHDEDPVIAPGESVASPTQTGPPD